MILYFALSYSPKGEISYNFFKKEQENFLISYFVLKKQTLTPAFLEGLGKHKVFLDSGAFSAFTKNTEINIQEYCDVIKKYKDIWKIYAGLDVIGDYKKTRENIEFMESQGLSPIPTFHFGSPLEELHRLCQKYDYIALGGLVPLALNRKKMEIWLDKCFSVIKNYWPKKLHGFGINADWIWRKYLFYSVDATSWNRGMKFGDVILQEGLRLTMASKKKHPDKFIQGTQRDWRYRTNIAVKSYKEMEEKITRLWDARGVKW